MMDSPRLRHYAALWTLRHYPHGSEAGEWSYDQKLAAVKAAGFDGFQSYARPEYLELSGKHNLAFLGSCDANATNYRQRLESFVPLNPVRINIQLCDHDTEPKEAARIWVDVLKAADDLGLAVDLEVHRDTCTETPEKTWQIADIFEETTGQTIRLNFDFSHFAVVKHLVPPYASRLLERPALLRGSRQIHLRPFNGHHCQIPVTDGRGKIDRWAEAWFEFVRDALGCWLEGCRGGEELWACPELGAMNSAYWLPSFPDPWKDAIFTRQETERLWRSELEKLSARSTMPRQE